MKEIKKANEPVTQKPLDKKISGIAVNFSGLTSCDTLPKEKEKNLLKSLQFVSLCLRLAECILLLFLLAGILFQQSDHCENRKNLS